METVQMSVDDKMIGQNEIAEAAIRISSHVRHTPILRVDMAEFGGNAARSGQAGHGTQQHRHQRAVEPDFTRVHAGLWRRGCSGLAAT